MEGVEEANKVAINSCYRVLTLLSQPKNQLQFRQIALETGESVSRFNKVILLLSNNKGHARSKTEKRKNGNLLPQINPICLLDHPVLSNFGQFAPNLEPSPSNSFQFHPKSKFSIDSASGSLAKTASTPKFNKNIFLESPILEIDPSSSSVNQNHQLIQQSSKPKLTHFQFTDERSKTSEINIDFENFSKANSVYSSLSVDGSGFQLISGAQSSDLVSPRPPPFKRKCHEKGENGEGKCGTSGKCHCAKKRYGFANSRSLFLLDSSYASSKNIMLICSLFSIFVLIFHFVIFHQIHQ